MSRACCCGKEGCFCSFVAGKGNDSIVLILTNFNGITELVSLTILIVATLATLIGS